MSAAYPLHSNTSSRLGPHRTHGKHNPCPVCKRETSHCLTFADGATICGKVPSDHPAGLGYMHWPNGRPANWQDTIRLLPPPTPRPPLDVELADRAYRALLRHCPLSALHRHALHARSLSDEQIPRHGYATGPANPLSRHELAAAVETEIGQNLAGRVPGFVRNHQGQLDLILGSAELLIPVLDVSELVVGIRRRLDHPGENGKYRWMSSPSDGENSIGIDGHTVHVARPLHLRTNHKVIVEGEIKANLTADAFGCIVISVPGVGNIQQVLPALEALDATDTVIAYDSDAATNPAVAAGESKLAHLLIDGGYQVAQWTWRQEDAKGIDDLLAVGLYPFPIPHPALRRTQSHEPAAEASDEVQRLNRERDALRVANQARARIQRNTHLPARPMAITLLGKFAQAATAANPAGTYAGKVPDGFVLAPVQDLAYDAGCKRGNASKQLKDLESPELFTRMSIKETLPAGQIDPETGEKLTTPRVLSRHFIAISGHEHERPTPEIVNGLIDRLAVYNSGAPEKRGGKRIPRCAKHPHAAVIKHWVARCSVCNDELATDKEPVPPMHLEPLSAHDQSLIMRTIGAEEDEPESHHEPEAAHDQSLTDRDLVPVSIMHQTPSNKASLGTRPIVYKDDSRGEIPAVDQTLIDRRRRAAEDLEARATRWQQADESQPPPEPIPVPTPLFALETAECRGCGVVIPERETYCADCDPYTA